MTAKVHSTNYYDTLICPAEDCGLVAEQPEKPGTVASMQYELLAGRPYEMTSDAALSTVAARRKGVDASGLAAFRASFFAKGQPCFRASPLTKTYGWAVHADGQGRIALVSPDRPEFAALVADARVTKVRAMRNRRA